MSPYILATALTAVLLLLLQRLSRNNQIKDRTFRIPKSSERVLILGASSGIGRSIAQEYAKRGAKICVVGRRKEMIESVASECRALVPAANDLRNEGDEGRARVFGVPADFSNVDDMVRVRSVIETEWSGLDTLIIAAGVSALQPLLSVAGVSSSQADASTEGIKHAVNAANAATQGNFIGPLVAGVTFIPLLEKTSPSPTVLLLSTVAAVIPAPTRSLYAASKAASLLLYQALSIEHPLLGITLVLPGTVEGDFRAGAIDSPYVSPSPSSPTNATAPPLLHEADPTTHGLNRTTVAQRSIRAIDHEERTVWMGKGLAGGLTYRVGHLLYWFVPGFVESRARRKYGFGV